MAERQVTPPPPSRRGTSPWVWVGLGCGLLVLLTVGGCIAFISYAGRNFAQMMEEEQKKWNLAEEILGMVRNADGALVPAPPKPPARKSRRKKPELREGEQVVVHPVTQEPVAVIDTHTMKAIEILEKMK